MDGDKTEGAVESKSLSRRPMDIWISVFGTERLIEPGFNQSIVQYRRVAGNLFTVPGAAAAAADDPTATVPVLCFAALLHRSARRQATYAVNDYEYRY